MYKKPNPVFDENQKAHEVFVESFIKDELKNENQR